MREATARQSRRPGHGKAIGCASPPLFSSFPASRLNDDGFGQEMSAVIPANPQKEETP
ncbi:MAG: hypothetical protein MPJ52_01830 [Alphaproteobacteria bacterium]|nr:hypothetical protein [Alphaproteobacteria bacterium]